MSQISEKQLRARIQQAQADQQHAAQAQHDKRMFVERDDGIDFWRETAMSWHKKARSLADQLRIAQHDVTGLGNEVKLTSIERDHWRAEYDQNYQDVLRAEARCDAISDIMDALARGWRMEPFDGCAKWWRHDTDTLQAIAKAAREWEAEQDSKPLPDHACVPCFTDTGPCTDPAQCHVGAQQVDPTSGEVEAEELIGIANHMAGSLGSMPDEWQAWAIEIEQDIRRAATRVRKIPDQVNPIDDGKAAQQADGFNGHMIGTDGDRVGFIRHAMNYGFEPEIGPLERLGSDALGDLYSTAFYYMNNNGHPLKVAE